MSAPLTLTQIDRPGVYAVDRDGGHWTTFQIIGRVVSPACCAICGAPLTAGWRQTVHGGTDRYVCDSHVVLRRPS